MTTVLQYLFNLPYITSSDLSVFNIIFFAFFCTIFLGIVSRILGK